ncbi:MAG: AAA-type ATPase lid domain-containing protein, partial [Burkholderiaceae bacterium]
MAEPIYQKILESKAIAWARLGLAKTMYMQDRLTEAESMLAGLVADNDKFMDAHGQSRMTFDADALQILLDHNWPGNVRELEN